MVGHAHHRIAGCRAVRALNRMSATSFDFASDLAALRAQGLLRQRRIADSACGPRVRVDGRDCLNFAGNDYLGLAAHPDMVAALTEGARAWGVGSGASHLVSGHQREHERLEATLAEFVDLPRALFFSTGYMANIGVLPSLVGRSDTVYADRLNHASLVDAAVLSRATVHRYAHADVGALARLLEAPARGRRLVVTDAVFSMDGDIAPLPDILALCERHDAWLVIDDAHGLGVLGECGRGTLAHFGLHSERLLYIGTLGKAAGAYGAFVAGPAQAIEWLMQTARSYRYTTASPAALACAVRTSVALMAQADERRARLTRAIARLRTGMAGCRRWALMPSQTAIQPLLVGGNEDAMALSARLLDQDIWVPAIRPPTVPVGQARLRISLSAAHESADIDRLVAALREAGA